MRDVLSPSRRRLLPQKRASSPEDDKEKSGSSRKRVNPPEGDNNETTRAKRSVKSEASGSVSGSNTAPEIFTAGKIPKNEIPKNESSGVVDDEVVHDADGFRDEADRLATVGGASRGEDRSASSGDDTISVSSGGENLASSKTRYFEDSDSDRGNIET